MPITSQSILKFLSLCHAPITGRFSSNKPQFMTLRQVIARYRGERPDWEDHPAGSMSVGSTVLVNCPAGEGIQGIICHGVYDGLGYPRYDREAGFLGLYDGKMYLSSDLDGGDGASADRDDLVAEPLTWFTNLLTEEYYELEAVGSWTESQVFLDFINGL